MDTSLTTGAIAAILEGNANSPLQKSPVLQVVSRVQPITNANSSGPQRYRFIISDGVHTSTAVMATQLNSLVDDGSLSRFTIIKLNQFNVTRKQQRNNDAVTNIIIALNIEPLSNAGDKIGDPQPYRPSATSPQIQQQPQQDNTMGDMSNSPQNTGQFGGSNFMSRIEGSRPQDNNRNTGNNAQSGNNISGTFDTSNSTLSGGARAPVHSGPEPTVHPINSLNPYQNKWIIRARVSQRSNIKTWNKPTSSGKLFNVNLIDESGEIRATGFNKQVDQFYNMLEVGKVYYISNARVTMARQQFSNVRNEYELVFGDFTQVELCQTNTDLPQIHYEFINLSRLGVFQKGNIIDALVVVRQIDDTTQIISRKGDASNPMTKRDLMVVDKSGFQVRLTLWGEDAINFSGTGEPVIAFKGVRVGDFNGRTLSLPSSGSFEINPDISEAHSLRGWYDAEGRSFNYQTYSSMAGGDGGDNSKLGKDLKTMSQVRDEGLGQDGNNAFFTVKGTIVFVRDTNIAYPACPNTDCNKKVVEDESTGQWHCEKCARSYPAPSYRYNFSINISDETGQNWVQCFNEIGEQLFGCTASDMVASSNGDRVLFKEKVTAATFKQCTFRCKARSDTFNETTRVRYSALYMNPIDYVSESQRLTKVIESYS